MSSVLGYNKDSQNGLLLNEEVLKDDGVTYVISSSLSRAVIDHLIYYMRDFFSDVIFQFSPTSGNTTVSILGKYPEDYANLHFPSIIVYVQNYATDMISMGDIVKKYGDSMVYGKVAEFEVIFDIWCRNQLELEGIVGSVIRLFDDANHDYDFLKRGFTEAVYVNTLGREFDITDKIVQTVSHLDSSINIRREQIVMKMRFIYRVNIPRVPSGDYMESITGDVTFDDKLGNTVTVSFTPTRRMYSQGITVIAG